MRRLEAVFWDVDGTLADTEMYGHRVSFNKAFATLNIDWIWDIPSYIRLLSVPGGKNRIAAYASSLKVDISTNKINQLHILKEKFYQEQVSNGYVPLRTGVKRLVHELSKSGVTQWIVTTSGRNAVEALILNHFGRTNPFCGAITYEDVEKLKPDPEAYLNAIGRSGVDPQNTIVIEDTIVGLLSSYAASIPCLLTLTEWNNFDQATMHKAYSVVNHLGEYNYPCEVFYGSSCQKGFITLNYLQHLINSG